MYTLCSIITRVYRVDANISVKVADFGLTRNIFESDYYIKRLNAKIPIKWMSPESLHDRVSNERTDVVSSSDYTDPVCVYS